MTVVLDTNALMMPVECDIRLFEELERLLGAVEAVVPALVLAELDRLATEGSPTERTAATVGSDLARDRCEIRETEAETADDAVLELALRPGTTHAVTNDAPLRDRLQDAGVPVISLRGTNKLAITQP